MSLHEAFSDHGVELVMVVAASSPQEVPMSPISPHAVDKVNIMEIEVIIEVDVGVC